MKNNNNDDHDEEEDFVPLVATTTTTLTNDGNNNNDGVEDMKSSPTLKNINSGIIKKQSSTSSFLFGSIYFHLRRFRIILPIMIILLLAICFSVYKDRDIDGNNNNNIPGHSQQAPTNNNNIQQDPSQQQQSSSNEQVVENVPSIEKKEADTAGDSPSNQEVVDNVQAIDKNGAVENVPSIEKNEEDTTSNSSSNQEDVDDVPSIDKNKDDTAAQALVPVDTSSTNNESSKSVNLAVESSAMMKNFATAKENLMQVMNEQYGKYFDDLFIENSTDPNYNRGAKVFQQAEGGMSANRFKRKAMMKLLQVITNIAQATPGTRVGLVPYIWATGGHSAAAGHGNHYYESMTAYLERAAKGMFESVGLNFIARNYAMGATASGPEVALCSKEIFGQDIDVLLWDYGMTDGQKYELETLYFYRASLTANRPACISYHTDLDGNRWDVIKAFDDRGVTALNSDEHILRSVLDAVPDTFGLTEEQIEELPLFVRNFKCDKQIETGDPYCNRDKFNQTGCPNRRYQVSWHPGWKWHAVMGYLAAFFLIDVFEAALAELSSSSKDPFAFLAELKAEEDVEYQHFMDSDIPGSFARFAPPEKREMIDMELIARGNNFCHTAKLPAEIRFKGILTESNETGFFTYDKGISLEEANKSPNTAEVMRLVWDPAERKFDWEHICEDPAGYVLDFKDYFYLHQELDDWKYLELPNNMELKEYGSPGQQLKGLIIICFGLCFWGQCDQGFLALPHENIPNGQLELIVNDIPVTNATSVMEHIQDGSCHILENENGMYFTPNEDGKFKIMARVLAEHQFTRISAVIIY